MKALAVFTFITIFGYISCAASKEQLVFRIAILHDKLNEVIRDLTFQDPDANEIEIALLNAQAQLLRTLNQSIRLSADSDQLTSGFEKTLIGIETTVNSQVDKIQVYGSHLLHSTGNPSDVVTNESPTEEVTKDITTTQDSGHSTAKTPDSSDFANLIKRAADLTVKAQAAIKKLTDAHRISEALNMESNVKSLEQKIDELKIYLSELNSIKGEIESIESKITEEIKSV